MLVYTHLDSFEVLQHVLLFVIVCATPLTHWKIKTKKAVILSFDCHLFSGKRGIRTPGPSQVNGFQDRRIRPLCHLSCWNIRRCARDAVCIESARISFFFELMIEKRKMKLFLWLVIGVPYSVTFSRLGLSKTILITGIQIPFHNSEHTVKTAFKYLFFRPFTKSHNYAILTVTSPTHFSEGSFFIQNIKKVYLCIVKI